jgi:hypothetical protein
MPQLDRKCKKSKHANTTRKGEQDKENTEENIQSEKRTRTNHKEQAN